MGQDANSGTVTDKETSMRVRQWLEEFIDWLSHDIERAEIDEEREY